MFMNEKLRVLVVEDDLVCQEFARRHLEPHAEVIMVGSVNAARRALKNAQPIAFIILDGRVPHWDNEPLRPSDLTIDLAKYIVWKYQNTIPMYSASSDDELNQKLANAGCVLTDKKSAINAVIAEIGRQSTLK
jgi:CheY-like chemotaxis protein